MKITIREILYWGGAAVSLIDAMLFGLGILDPLSPADMCSFLFLQFIIVILLAEKNFRPEEDGTNGEDQNQS